MAVLGALIVLGNRDYRLPEEWLAFATRSGAEAPVPIALSGILSSIGTLFGMLAGVAWMDTRGGWRVSGPWSKRVVRYVVGVLGVLILWYGLGAIFPRGESLIPYILRFVRYALLGIWVSAGAPMLFAKTRLA